MLADRTLPGLAPDHIRLTLDQTPRDGWVLMVWAGDGPGFVARREMDRYENLTWLEAMDVLAAVLDGMGGS